MAYIEWWNRTGPITMGERFGLNEISTRAKPLSPTKSYAKDWRKDEDWDDKGPWDIPPKDPFKDLDWDDRVDMKPGGIVEPGVTNYAKFGSEEIAKFKKMRAAGATGEEIFKKIGMSIPHQQYLKKKLNLPAIKVNPAHFKPVELTAKMKKYVKDFETESGEKYKNQTAHIQYSIRQGTWSGQLSVTDPERLLKIKKYIEKFKKNNGELPTVNEVRQHFQKTINKDLEKPIKAAMKKYNIVLPSGFGRQSTEIVDADIRKLLKNNSILKTLDAGKFPTDSQIQAILKVDRTLAETRSIDLANTLKGTRVIRLFEAPKKYKSLATSFLKSQEGTDAYKPKMTRSRVYHEKALTKLLDLDEPIKKIRGSIINKITSFIPEAKGLLHVDEIAGLTSSMRRGSGPYAIFGQVVGSDFNSIVKALTIDKDKGIAEKKLVKLAKDDPERIVTQKKYNQKIIDFEREANKNNPAKKVRGFKLSFKHPSDAIKNKNVYLKYKKLFDTHFKKYGFSWEVPADREAIPEILKKLDNKDFQKVVRNRFLKIAGKGGKTGALVALATLAGTGWALADDKTLEPSDKKQEASVAKGLTYGTLGTIAAKYPKEIWEGGKKGLKWAGEKLIPFMTPGGSTLLHGGPQNWDVTSGSDLSGMAFWKHSVDWMKAHGGKLRDIALRGGLPTRFLPLISGTASVAAGPMLIKDAAEWLQSRIDKEGLTGKIEEQSGNNWR